MAPKIKSFKIGDNYLVAEVLESGNLKEIRDDIVRINTYVGNNLEPTVSNIYLRVGKKFSRLIGIGSLSEYSVVSDKLGSYIVYSGVFEKVQYYIIFSCLESVLLYQVKLLKNPGVDVEVFYGLDVSLSNIYAISNNEAYVSQYVDHKAYKDNNGYVLCSRQNSDNPYYLESGSIGGNVSYSIDGFQFFGLDYKFTNTPVALTKEHLDNKIYQYEFGYHALQSELISLNEDYEITFYSCYNSNHPEVITKPLYFDKVKEVYEKVKNREFNLTNKVKLELKFTFDDTVKSNVITEKEVNDLFKNIDSKEVIDGKLVSFFNKDDKSHVVIARKEGYLERPSGNIIYSLNRDSNNLYDFEHVIASTGFIFGLFNSLLCIGNTSFNRLLSGSRNPLNIQKISGERVFIKRGGKYQLLTMPALFIMGFNYLKWIYKIDGDTLEFTTFASNDESKIEFSFKSLNNKEYELLITNNLIMGERERSSDYTINRLDSDLIIEFGKDTMTYGKYPELAFKVNIDKPFELLDDKIFYSDNLSRGEDLLVYKLNTDSFNLLITSTNNSSKHLDFNQELNKTNNYINYLTNNFEISEEANRIEISSLNYLVYWYTHDALVHYISPHGLEQYSGAAWGTRDVCQGPAEYFLAFNKFENVKQIILDVYKHQFLEDGDFPQWFMFDRYFNIQDSSSHGDVIVWPLRLVALYLEESKDVSILNELVEYTSRNGIYYTEKYPLIDHIKKEIETITNNYIKGTNLSCYGGGDWDDTLQPAIKEYKKEMVSGWTTSLTYEAYNRLGVALLESEYSKLGEELITKALKIKEDYHKYIIKDGIPAGFIHFEGDKIKYIIHPSDEDSHISYRLLPLTRGIIGGMFTKDESLKMMNLIFNNLLFPDGVRLMNNTVKYNGGVKTYFNRAETASNFGREIGLQYSHANVRYCEALSKLGFGSNLLSGLSKINPVIVTDYVTNSLPRQRNSYFSSSDGCFDTRYEAMENFTKLKTQEVKVKGGWRVYSSGPGIFLRTLIEDMLGIRVIKDEVNLNPVIDSSLGDIDFRFDLLGRKTLFKFHNNALNKKLIVNGLELKPLSKGFSFSLSLLDQEENHVEVYLNNPLINKEIKGCLDYFIDESKDDGLTLDKIFTDHKEDISSMASVGFSLASLVIGVERGLISHDTAYKLTRKTIDTLKSLENFKGLLPHFVNTKTKKNEKSEFSTIDTAICFMGCLASAFYFKGDIERDVIDLVNRVDWDHFITEEDGKYVIKMAYSKYHWQDNGGYTKATWNHYAEQLMIYYLYAMQYRTSSEMSQKLYLGFNRHVGEYKGLELIQCYSNALFIHQFTHCFIDFSKIKPIDNIDWSENSKKATLANRLYCINQTWSKTYNSLSWGLSAFQGKDRYRVFGAPPFGFPDNPYKQELDGSVTPYASLSSIVFTPKYSIESLEYFNTVHGLNGKYGLFDSYNFDDYYISNCYIGIDKGPTIIMLDNFQNRTIWNLFMNNDYSIKAMEKLNFKIK